MDNIRVLGAKSGIRSPYFALASYAVLLAVLLWTPPAHATCPSDEGLRQLLNSEIQTATEGISSFQSILESRPLTNPISVTKLIFIDLNNETLVANRLGEIRKKLAAPELTLAERFPDCHQFTKPLMALQQA
ncbi:MAG: hypothetical protein KDD39_16620, partial [Bdellovibrionales bacterium]|nr:hypothetical protein [Bdellovibrionales bacterium]